LPRCGIDGRSGHRATTRLGWQHTGRPQLRNRIPYKWLWQDPQQSPFIIANASTPGGVPLNYVNQCTLDFITDVCKYWIDTFSVDGFRFDQVSGFDNVPSQGAKPLMSNLKTYLATLGNTVFPLIIEDHLNFDDINDTNNDSIDPLLVRHVPLVSGGEPGLREFAAAALHAGAECRAGF
jgi:glycosidase